MAYPTSDPLTHCHVHTHSPSLFVPGLRGHVSFSIHLRMQTFIASLNGCLTEPGSQPTPRAMTSTSTTPTDTMTAATRSLPAASLSGMEPRWPWTRHSFHHSIEKASLDAEEGGSQGRLCRMRARENLKTYPELLNNQRCRWVGQCWQWKPQAGGTRMVEPSATTWHEQEPDTATHRLTARWSATLCHPTITPLAPTFLGEARKMSTMSKPVHSIGTWALEFCP